ncbi:hypothetical protein [Xanthovirga aplysinae]|uniref:hypothetical protein n=1 Tax=Xanthovirga aplysinae TaxID=2529853 RepID=UPI0012BD7F39|nr:hypothetical protein [Xanthovirga aplysinae]MTI29490.1 hypothetical protein [Xanthovirga aplysinae]
MENNASKANPIISNTSSFLKALGHTEDLERYRTQQSLTGFGIGRVILEHKERFVVKTENGDLEGELTGNLRFSAESKNDLPSVGDWVAILKCALSYKSYPVLIVNKKERTINGNNGSLLFLLIIIGPLKKEG